MKKLLMGNEAFAWAALTAGVNVVAGYPGTPSSELVETVARLHADGTARGVHVEWSTNEKAALELLAGASLSGARCLFTCKQVGLNVASDALMSLNYVGIRGGLVLFVADDPGPISSQTEQDTRRFAAFAKVPVLDPASPEEGWAMMQHAFDLSEAYGTPVIVRPTTRVNHASTFFELPDGGTDARPLPEGGFERSSRWVIFPKRAYEAHGEVNDRLRAIASESAEGPFNAIEQVGESPRLGIVAGGISAAYARDALAMLSAGASGPCSGFGAGLSPLGPEAGQLHSAESIALPAYRFMQVGTPYPFPAEAAARFAEGLDEVLVLEELDHALEDEMLRLAGRRHLPYEVRGKLDGTTPARGENSIDALLPMLAEFLGTEASVAPSAADMPSGDTRSAVQADSANPPSCAALSHASMSGEAELPQEEDGVRSAPAGVPAADGAGFEPAPEPPARPPVLCAGCPHRGAFWAVKRALHRRKAVFCGDIGCYTLGNAAPLDAVDTCLCMGGGITMAQGFATAEPDRKAVAFVGDSTFFASGLTGVANAVYNQHDITICLLDNATTAMTGTQPHPGTGVTLMGPKTEPILPEAVLEALGVQCIEFANPLYLEESEAAARRAIDFPGPAAVIFRSPCTQIVAPEKPAWVEVDVCTGCGACVGKIGCPAFSMTGPGGDCSPGRATLSISPRSCYGCGLCVISCPFGAIHAPVLEEGRIPHDGKRGTDLDKRRADAC